MLALILREADWHPSFLIGGDLNEVGTNASWDDGEWLVVEADESDGTFLEFAPEAAIVTNVEPDHLTHWGDFPALVAGFERFLAGVPGTRVVSADDTVAARLASQRRDEVATFGFADDADYQIRELRGEAQRLAVRARAARRTPRCRRAPGAGPPQREERRGRGRDGDRRSACPSRR